jgi:hypothetical protein
VGQNARPPELVARIHGSDGNFDAPVWGEGAEIPSFSTDLIQALQLFWTSILVNRGTRCAGAIRCQTSFFSWGVDLPRRVPRGWRIVLVCCQLLADPLNKRRRRVVRRSAVRKANHPRAGRSIVSGRAPRAMSHGCSSFVRIRSRGSRSRSSAMGPLLRQPHDRQGARVRVADVPREQLGCDLGGSPGTAAFRVEGQVRYLSFDYCRRAALRGFRSERDLRHLLGVLPGDVQPGGRNRLQVSQDGRPKNQFRSRKEWSVLCDTRAQVGDRWGGGCGNHARIFSGRTIWQQALRSSGVRALPLSVGRRAPG